MAVYRVNKNRGYTVMANYHLRDKTLSLKAVGLLSKMLSFNDGWQFSTKGLSAICKEGPDAVLAALRELEDHGYLIRHRQRDAKGRMRNTVFEIYEQPQPVSPHRENPDVDNPDMDNPHMENPHGENPAQLNTNQVINNQRNNSLINYQSINLDGMDRMDEREQYRELIRDNLEIDIRSPDKHYDLDRVNEIVEIMLDAVCSTSPTIRINGEDGKCMVRVKATGETTEVDREVMKALRNEEKKLRRSYDTGGASDSEDGEETQPSSVLSLDAVPEDEVNAPTWLADPHDFTNEVVTKIQEAEFMEQLTAREREVFLFCIQYGGSQQEYAASSGLSISRVCKLVAAIRKKAKIFF